FSSRRRHTRSKRDWSSDVCSSDLTSICFFDFSHANSSKQSKKQMDVCADVCQQIAGGEKAIIGVMVESHLVEGNQSLESGEPLRSEERRVGKEGGVGVGAWTEDGK